MPKLEMSRHRAGDLLIVSLNPTSARLWWSPCGVAWDAIPEPMVEFEYIDPYFYDRNVRIPFDAFLGQGPELVVCDCQS